MKRTIVLAGTMAAIALCALSQPAQAMGSGNPYEDQQVGVSYTVYQPSYTAGLKTPTQVTDQPACPAGTEASLRVPYGTKAGLGFTVTEGHPMCSDIGTGPVVLTTTIKGAKAVVEAYCPPARAKTCSKADVRRYGGHLAVTLPAAKGLKDTAVWVETSGGKRLSADQLVRVATSMRPVA